MSEWWPSWSSGFFQNLKKTVQNQLKSNIIRMNKNTLKRSKDLEKIQESFGFILT